MKHFIVITRRLESLIFTLQSVTFELRVGKFQSDLRNYRVVSISNTELQFTEIRLMRSADAIGHEKSLYQQWKR